MAKLKTDLFLPAAASPGERRPMSVFVRGLVDGLGSAATLGEPMRLSRARYKGRGLRGDWIAVGGSMRRALGSSG